MTGFYEGDLIVREKAMKLAIDFLRNENEIEGVSLGISDAVDMARIMEHYLRTGEYLHKNEGMNSNLSILQEARLTESMLPPDGDAN